MTELEQLLAQAEQLAHTAAPAAAPATPEAPTEVPATASQEVASASQYVTAYGDTLASIAATYGLSVERLMTLNGLVDPDMVIVGMSLQVG